MAFHSMLPPVSGRPNSRRSNGPQGLNALRANFNATTWLLLGACLQSLIVFIIPRFYAMLPSLLILAARLADTMAITWGWKKNHYLDEALLHRVSPQIPDEDGNFHSEASEEKVVVFMLGAKSNHPLGVFAPNFAQIGGYLTGMIDALESDSTVHGFYGGSSWTKQDKNGASEYLFLSYWRSTADVHQFAYGPVHRKAWDWWTETVAANHHLGINHEIFEVDRKHWEAVYLNFQPTLLGATTYLRKGDQMIGGTVDDAWISPLVDARTGRLRNSAGRLGRDPGQLYEKYEMAPGGTMD